MSGALTIRNLDDEVKRALRKRAAERGVSMEQEARDALRRDLGLAARKRRKPTLEDLMALSRKPAESFDLKRISDEMWEEGLTWPSSSSTPPR
jgi:plasmid stability protein